MGLITGGSGLTGVQFTGVSAAAYGVAATASGATNRAGINQAITAAAALAGSGVRVRVVLPAGNLTIDSTINGASNIILDLNGCLLSLANGANAYSILFSSQTNFDIVNGTVDNNYANQSGAAESPFPGWNGCGVAIYNCSYFTLDKLWVRNSLLYNCFIYMSTDYKVRKGCRFGPGPKDGLTMVGVQRFEVDALFDTTGDDSWFVGPSCYASTGPYGQDCIDGVIRARYLNCATAGLICVGSDGAGTPRKVSKIMVLNPTGTSTSGLRISYDTSGGGTFLQNGSMDEIYVDDASITTTVGASVVVSPQSNQVHGRIGVRRARQVSATVPILTSSGTFTLNSLDLSGMESVAGSTVTLVDIASTVTIGALRCSMMKLDVTGSAIALKISGTVAKFACAESMILDTSAANTAYGIELLGGSCDASLSAEFSGLVRDVTLGGTGTTNVQCAGSKFSSAINISISATAGTIAINAHGCTGLATRYGAYQESGTIAWSITGTELGVDATQITPVYGNMFLNAFTGVATRNTKVIVAYKVHGVDVNGACVALY